MRSCLWLQKRCRGPRHQSDSLCTFHNTMNFCFPHFLSDPDVDNRDSTGFSCRPSVKAALCRSLIILTFFKVKPFKFVAAGRCRFPCFNCDNTLKSCKCFLYSIVAQEARPSVCGAGPTLLLVTSCKPGASLVHVPSSSLQRGRFRRSNVIS